MLPVANNGVHPFRFQSLNLPGLRHGITGRVPGLPAEGDVSYVTGPDGDTVRENRRYWGDRIGIDWRRIATAQQCHGDRVRVVGVTDAGRGADSASDGFPNCDALITREPGIPLLVVAADCVPILLYDPVQRAIGAVHSGWRGTVAGIIMRTVEAMRDELGSRPTNLLVGLGPSIGPCCYEVGPEVIAAWEALGVDPQRQAVLSRQPRPYFDLWAANELALAAVGVPAANVERAGLCTRCHADHYFSRRAGVGYRGLFGALIALEDEEP